MKTKKILTAMVLSSISCSGFAQFNTEPAPKSKWGLSIAMNSIQAQVEIPLLTATGGILVDADGNIITPGSRVDKSYSFSVISKYQINNDILLRFEFGITNLNLQANVDAKGGLGHNISTTEINSRIYRYTPGFQWTFMKTKRIESYCGMTATYVNYKDVNNTGYGETRDFTTDTLQSIHNSKANTPGGFAAGVGALAGFNIYLHRRISIGAEFSSSALYYKLGGITASETTGQNFPNPISTETSTHTNSYKAFKISKIISSFNISIWF